MIEGLACAWPTGSVGSRESPAMSGYRVGLTAPGSRPRLPGLSMGFRTPRPHG
jgi:hypothetical protein